MLPEMPEWAQYTKERLFDCNPEYCAEPYPHLVLIERNVFGTEQYWATLDTFKDVMHLAMRSGSYAGLEVGNRTAGDIAQWFETKVTEVIGDELRELRLEVGKDLGLL